MLHSIFNNWIFKLQNNIKYIIVDWSHQIEDSTKTSLLILKLYLSDILCLHCGLTLCSQLDNIIQHCKSCESAPRPDPYRFRFVCYACNYNSYLVGNIKKHVRIHLGDKPYKCSFCPYRCVQKNCLDSHIARFH